MADFSLPNISQGVLDAASSISNGISNFSSSDIGKKALGIIDPSNVRLQLAGLLPGGSKATTSGATAQAKFAGEATDWRVKISLATNADYFYKGPNAGILAPLLTTGGVIFPYTPSISVTHAARYSSQQLTHSNYTNYSYDGSEVQAITVTGDFTAQDNAEAAYVLACLHFFRSATKMWFGGSSNVGNPPPMVFLNGYGAHYFPNVPCVITSFAHTMPADVDYIQAITVNSASVSTPIPTKNIKPGEGAMSQSQATPTSTSITTQKQQATMIPTTSQMVITLQPIYSRKNVFNNFSLDEFAKGKLLGDGNSGGFI